MFRLTGKVVFALCAAMAAFGASEARGAALQSSDGTNPIVKDRFSPDPAPVVDGDTLYVFTGHDEPDARGYKMKDWQVFSTKDMVHWLSHGAVMDTSTFKWARQGDRAWASQAIKRNGKWHRYVAVQHGKGGDAIGVATADSVEGPWTDPVGDALLRAPAGYIDPSVFIDDDGKAWLFWGNCGGNPGCWYVELKENMHELAGEVKPVAGLMDEAAFGAPLWKKWGAGHRRNGEKNTNFEEAPWIYKLNGTYYLEYAAGGCPEFWAYSTAKSIHGPWTYRGAVTDCAENTGTIHGGSVFFKGSWYLVYHNANLPNGADCRRSFCIEKYTRNPDGSIPFVHQTKSGVSRAGATSLAPTLWADVPDIAMCRKGKKFYMVSTSMHFNPGIPVMVSTNLVDWKTASYCYETIENRPKDRLDDGRNDYSGGTWASSIRYDAQGDMFYVTSFNNQIDSTYLFWTRDPEKEPWSFSRLSPKQYDESLWIEDGRFWIYATVPGRPYKVRLTELKEDLSGFKDRGEIVLDNVTDCCGGGGLGEGTQVFKRNGWYYLVNIAWPRGNCRTVVVHRGKTRRGPWEGKVVLQREGIAQGSFIDDADGNWYGYFFGDRGAVGRCPYILPVTWEDDWPVVGRTNLVSSASPRMPGVVASDEFNSGKLDIAWQWNHNPVESLWSLTARPGWMRLSTDRLDGDLLSARNTLTQRCWGPACRAVTKLDVSGMKPGDWAGIAFFQKEYGFIGVRKTSGGRVFVEVTGPAVKRGQGAVAELRRGAKEVYLKAIGDFARPAREFFNGNPEGDDLGRFAFSEDGVAWFPLGRSFKMRYTIPHFTGYRFALFYFSTEEAGGHVDFDFLRLD